MTASVFLRFAAVTLLTSMIGAHAQDLSRIDIKYEKFVLPNGLTVIVHEDRKTPIVAVNIWYHVGSKNELKGRTGFAHLFEHLMFNGTEHYNQDYFKVLEKLGATDLNGTTNEDRTNYFQNVPTSALDTVLWMESDRMGHLLGVVDQARLDEQRGVVQNEKRQGENQPYGLVYEMLQENSFPASHPYSWTVIGSMDDLNAATLKDVQEWFKKYYGPSNATLVLAGDIDAKTAREKAEKYFGHIPSGPPLPRHAEWIAKRTDNRRLVLQDRVPQARIYKAWNVPPGSRKETAYLDLFSTMLANGKTSRLYQRLVHKDQIATDVRAIVDGLEIAGTFLIYASAKPGVELAAVEKAINEELTRFINEGPTADELKRAQTRHYANLVRGLERIGGFGGKSDILAQGQVYTGDPLHYKKEIQTMLAATPQDIKKTAADWLSSGALDLEVQPFAKLTTSKTEVDRSKPPEPGPISDAKFPKFERATLSNGLNVILAERHTVPTVSLALVVDSGYASDKLALPGVAKLATNMLDEGTKSRTALQISEELETLGSRLNTGVGLDASYVVLSSLKENLDPSLNILSDVVLNASFPQSDFERERQQQLAAIQREKVQPMQMAIRLIPGMLYGKDHPYSSPMTGSGSETSVKQITRDHLAKFHQTWFRPNNVTVVVVGDTTMAEIKPKLEKALGSWAKGEVPKLEVSKVEHQEKPAVYLLDRPGSIQSTIIASHVAPPRANDDEVSFATLNTIFGGAFTSRINMNLREDKHWSYGAGSFMPDARGQRPFLVVASVQTDKTKESMVEMRKELTEIVNKRPATEEELNFARDTQVLGLAGSRETNDAILNNILELVLYRLPDNYHDTLATKARALTTKDMATAAERLIRPDKLVWVVVGDRAKVEAGLRELNVADIQLIDADGNPVK